MAKIFIDGSEGTTGLRIADRLAKRSDVEIIKIDEAKRKDAFERAKCINASDITFLCLPDAAAVEAVTLVNNASVRIIDASTAHRTEKGWTYGLAELDAEHLEEIKTSKRVAVPGCHASGFVTLVYPLVKSGVLSRDEVLSCFSLTGYSGGGKKMIAEYESAERSPYLSSPRQYGLSQSHKHLKEMKAVCGLTEAPIFSPIVCDFYSGMEVSVPLGYKQTGMTARELRDFYAEYYKDKKLIRVMEFCDEKIGGFIPAGMLEGRDDLRIYVAGNDERAVAVALFDNLGKGASGSAIEIMNLMLGLDETEGLNYLND